MKVAPSTAEFDADRADDRAIRLSVLMPVYREEENIRAALVAIAGGVQLPHEVIVVYDDEADPTVPIVREIAKMDERVRPVRNVSGSGRGLLNAIRTGIREARGPAVIVAMGDATDDIRAVGDMWSLYEEGFSVVAPSRYAPGGRMVGGPLLKRVLSRFGGTTLRLLTGLPTSDPTNAFKLWDARFLRETPIESTGGFEYSLELCAKAFVQGRRIAEFPTVCRERSAGSSKFRLWSWLPRYVRWYIWLVARTLPRRLLRTITRSARR